MTEEKHYLYKELSRTVKDGAGLQVIYIARNKSRPNLLEY